MEGKNCTNCTAVFQKRSDGRGYLRFSIERNLPNTNTTARDLVETMTSNSFTPSKSKHQGEFLCPACWSTLNNTHRYRVLSSSFWGKTSKTSYLAGKLTSSVVHSPTFDPRLTSTPKEKGESGSCKTLFPTSCTKDQAKKKPAHKWISIANYVKQRNYTAAIKGLYRASPGSKKHFINVVKAEIRQEVKVLLKSDFILSRTTDMTAMEEFSWNNLFEQVQQGAPLLTGFLKASSTLLKNEMSMRRGKKQSINVLPVVGTALSCLLYARAPTVSFLPTVVSLQLWRGGLKRTTMNQLSKLGICFGEKATLSAVDRLIENFDAAADTCRTELEKQLNSEQRFPSIIIDPQESCDVSLALSQMENVDAEVNSRSDSESTSSCDVNIPQFEVDSPSDGDITEGEESISSEEESTEQDILSCVEPLEQGDTQVEHISTFQPGCTGQSEDGSLQVLHQGFTLCWDNVGKKVTTSLPSPDRQNLYINFALGYLAVNRIPSSHLDYKANVLATEIPTTTFLPSPDDFNEVRFRMEVLVSRMLVRHIDWFTEHFGDCVIKHILHDYSNESAQRSVLVNLGVFEENPSTTAGAIRIYERFQKYIPFVGGQPYPTLVFGDSLSCERGNDALRARCNGATKTDRLEGLEPAAQEFHKEMIMLQDYFDEYFKGNSARERGTLYNNKNILNFRNVKQDANDNFSHSWELMCQTTESYVCLLAMEILGLSDQHDRPPNAPLQIEHDTIEKRRKYLTDVSQNIVSKVWHHMDINVFHKDPGDDANYCCKEELDGGFIGCDSREHCLRGEWFHYSCVGIDQEDQPDIWYCSEECRTRSNEIYRYCFCLKDLGTSVEMIGCSAGSSCTNREWYHLPCIGMSHADVPKGNWYCCDECRQLSLRRSGETKKRKVIQDTGVTYVPDFKYRHNIAITWSGLDLLVRRDAVREGDGNAIMSHWRIDLVQFFSKRHPKYVILAHRLLASINGWLPDKLAQEIRWNRTVNYSGGMGRNLPADLMNEIFNRLFKELLKDAKGHHTSKTLARCSQIIGPLGEALDVVFESKLIENEVYRHRRRSVNRDENVNILINRLKKGELFRLTPGRTYKAFPAYEFVLLPKFPGRFLQKMKDLSAKLDTIRRVVLE